MVAFRGFTSRRASRAALAARAVTERAALHELLAGWRFIADQQLTDLVWDTLRNATLEPTPVACALSFAPLPEISQPPDDGEIDATLTADLAADLTEVQHRERLTRWWRANPPAAPIDPTIWGLDTLGWLGQETEEIERGAWTAVAWASAGDDHEIARMWQRLSDGGFWGDRAAWTRLLMNDVTAVFRSVADAQKLPAEVTRRAIADLRDVLPYKIAVGGKAEGGLAQIAARIIETGPAGPVTELLSTLSEGGLRAACACISRRGHWPDTLAALFPNAGPVERAVRAAPLVTPQQCEALLDLHVVMRLIERWSEEGAGDPSTDWAVIVQNRGRSRGRLRALLSEEAGTAVSQRFVSWQGLAARTRAAARRWAWEWAWEELALDFSFDAGRPVGVPCRHEGEVPSPLEGEEVAILSVWVLRVVLRNRIHHLRRWVSEGSTGDHDATWGRLLVEIPDALRDGPTGRYGRVRAHLVDRLDAVLSGYRPLFAALAALPDDRTAMARFRTLTEPLWHDAIPAIASGIPAVRRSASEAFALTSDTVMAEDT